MKKVFSCLLFFMVASLLTWGMTSGDEAKANNEMVVPFALQGHVILVQCRINDVAKAYDFILDTGGRTFVDKTLADELQLKQQGPMAKINMLRIGDFSFENVFVFTQFDFEQFKTRAGITINGIIGSDFLDDYTVTIDYRNQRLILNSDTESLAGQKEKNGQGYFFKFFKHPMNNAPMIQCRVNGGIEVAGMIDTGQPFALVLPLDFLEKTGALKQKDTIQAKGVIAKWPFTTRSENYLSRVKTLAAEELLIENVTTLYAELPAMLSVALLGRDFLSQYLIKINYPKSELLLLPLAGSKIPDNLFSTGLATAADAANNILVKGVWEKSPAEKAGIVVGDQILAFNATKLTLSSFQELNQLLKDEKVKTVEIIIKNNKGQRKILLQKENLLPAYQK